MTCGDPALAHEVDERRARCVQVAMAFVGGCVDAVGYVALLGLFTAQITGNSVAIAVALARGSGGFDARMLVVPAFLFGVVLARVIARVVLRRGGSSMRTLIVLEVLLLLLTLTLSLCADKTGASDAPVVWAAVLAAAAMGVQTANARMSLPAMVPATVMTSNITQFTIDSVDVLTGDADAGTRRRLLALGAPIAGFASGALIGAVGFTHFGAAVLALPIAILLTLVRERRRPAIAWRRGSVAPTTDRRLGSGWTKALQGEAASGKAR